MARGEHAASTCCRMVHVDGWEVLVGKGARDNDELTFRVAEANDLWLHAAGYPGSHVVVRNPDRVEVPREVVRRAAELAVFNSKAREARGKVDVHVCRAGDVRKVRGAPAGQVQLSRWDTVKVYSRPE
ncbi:MAG TPA: NFACT RNA binding domain-containing protein [Gemmatimonadales bacterium]|nr:NFACT RNA binding domain-containing protein [Gemmatimonadales bacterium]